VAIRPYVLKLKPNIGESLLGYMHRLAVRNKHDIPYWIKYDIGLKTNTASLTERQLENLSFISGRPVEELVPMQSPPAVDGRTTFMGWPILESEIERGRSRLCPACVADDAFHRQIWNLRVATVCPLHGIPLIDECPVCSEPLTWTRVDIFSCINGHNLRRHQRTRGTDHFSSSDLLGVRALYEKCRAPENAGPVLRQLPDVIRKLDLTELMAFLLFVGRAALRDKASCRPAGAARYDAGKTHRVLQAGFDIARNWPASFATLMDKLHAHRRSHQVGFGPGFMRLFRMFDKRDSAFLEVVKSPIREYANSRHLLLQKPTRRLLGFKEAAQSEYVSATEAGKIMGCCRETASKIAVERGWCSGRPGTGNVVRIPRSKAEEWARQETTITLSQAGRFLGLGPAGSIAILKEGLLQCVPCRNGEAHPRGWHVVRKSEVDRLLNAIRKSVRKASKPDRGPLVSWYSFRRRRGGEGLSAGALFQAMLDGRLLAICVSDNPLQVDELQFHLLDLIDTFAGKRAHNTPLAAPKRSPARRFVSINDAARIADVHPQSICRAFELKLIKADAGKGPRSAYRIELSGLGDFIQNYSTAGKLARQYGLHFTNICRLLEHLRVQPVGKRDGRYGHYPVYSIADLRRAHFSEAVAELGRQRTQAGSRSGKGNAGRSRAKASIS
jgi:hypothetical protein